MRDGHRRALFPEFQHALVYQLLIAQDQIVQFSMARQAA